MIEAFEGRVARRNAFLRGAFAAVLVAVAHVGALAWLFKHNLNTETPDSVQGVPLELDLLAVAPPEPPHDVGAPAPTAPPPQATPDASPPSPEPTPTQEPPPPPPPPSPEPPPPSPEPPPPSPEVTTTPPPTQEPPPSPAPSPELPTPTPTQTPPPSAVVEPAPPPPPPSKAKPEPQKPKPEPVKPKPRPTPTPAPKIDTEKLEEREAAEDKARERAEARKQARAAAAARSSKEDARETTESRQGASARPVSSGTNLATWRGEVLARISEFKPSGNGSSGTAVVAFTVDGGGRVVSAHVVRSSGDASLDAASVAMVRSASPVPAPPPELGGHVNLSVPVRFQ